MNYKITRRGPSLSGSLLAFGNQLMLAATSKENATAFDLDHEHFMRLAIEQARKVPACPFGAVVVNIKTKEVLAQGWVRTNKNPIWHGEMTAINNCPDAAAASTGKKFVYIPQANLARCASRP